MKNIIALLSNSNLILVALLLNYSLILVNYLYIQCITLDYVCQENNTRKI